MILIREKNSLWNSRYLKIHQPQFLWHTVTDDCVPVENSLLFFNVLRKFEIPVEMHLYPVGGHGLSLANEETSNEDGGCVQKECQSWIELACKWMQNI